MNTWLTLDQARAKVGRSGTWLRRLARDEILISRHDAGILEISAESLAEYQAQCKARDTERKRKIRRELSGQHERPATRACAMIRRKVKKDKRLTDPERTLLISTIDRYEAEWDKSYRKRKGNHNGS